MKKRSIQVNAVLNGLKQCCTVIFPLITIPYVSRILGNANYGKVNFGSSIVSYFTLFAALGVSTYAIREGAKIREDKKKFTDFVSEVFTINIISTILSFAALAFLLLFWNKVEDYRILILIQSGPILFTTLGIGWTNNIFEDFFYTTVRYISIQGIAVVCMLAFVHHREDYLIYALITSLANIGGEIVNMIYIRKHYVRVRLTRTPNFRKHLKPLLYLFSITISATVYVNSDVSMLTLFRGDAETGVYSIATKVYTLVKQFINAIVGVALPRFSAYLGQDDRSAYDRLLNKTLHAVLLMILPGAVGMFVLSKEIILLIAGAEYVSGYIALRILAIALGFSVLSFMIVYAVMIPNGLDRQSLVTTIVSAAVNVGLNLFFIPLFGLNGAAFTTLISEIVVVGMGLRCSKGLFTLTLTGKEMVPCLLGCVEIAVICVLVRNVLDNVLLLIVVGVVGSILVYAITLIKMKDEVAASFYQSFRKKLHK